MAAIGRLFRLLAGESVTVQMADATDPRAPDGADEAAPMLVDGRGLVIWMLHPDDDATMRAARRARRRRFARRPAVSGSASMPDPAAVAGPAPPGPDAFR